MKTLSPLRSVTMAFCALSALLSLNSCSRMASPNLASTYVESAVPIVFSYNDVDAPNARIVKEMGPMPERAQRAIAQWLKKSEIKKTSYIYAQYFFAVNSKKSSKPAVWALCTDAKGNLLGIQAPRSNVDAWDLGRTGSYELYVCQGSERAGLSYAILSSLADAGYDAPRINARRASGLQEARYLISAATPKAAPIAKVVAKVKTKVEESSDQSDSAELGDGEDLGLDDFDDSADSADSVDSEEEEFLDEEL